MELNELLKLAQKKGFYYWSFNTAQGQDEEGQVYVNVSHGGGMCYHPDRFHGWFSTIDEGIKAITKFIVEVEPKQIRRYNPETKAMEDL